MKLNVKTPVNNCFKRYIILIKEITQQLLDTEQITGLKEPHVISEQKETDRITP